MLYTSVVCYDVLTVLLFGDIRSIGKVPVTVVSRQRCITDSTVVFIEL